MKVVVAYLFMFLGSDSSKIFQTYVLFVCFLQAPEFTNWISNPHQGIIQSFRDLVSSPRGGVGTSLPGLTSGIPTHAWETNIPNSYASSILTTQPQ